MERNQGTDLLREFTQFVKMREPGARGRPLNAQVRGLSAEGKAQLLEPHAPDAKTLDYAEFFERFNEVLQDLGSNAAAAVREPLPTPAGEWSPLPATPSPDADLVTLLPFTIVVQDSEGRPIEGAEVRSEPSITGIGRGIDSRRTNKEGVAECMWPLARNCTEYKVLVTFAQAPSAPKPKTGS